MKIAPNTLAARRIDHPLNRTDTAPAAATAAPLGPADFTEQLRKAKAATQPTSFERPPMRPLTQADMLAPLKAPLKPQKSLADDAAIPPMRPLADDTDYRHASSRPAPTQDDKVKETARKWVAQTFYGAMLKQMRQSPNLRYTDRGRPQRRHRE